MVSGEVHQMWKEVLMCGSRDSADRTGVLRLPDAVSVLLDATGRRIYLRARPQGVSGLAPAGVSCASDRDSIIKVRPCAQ